MRVEMNHIQAVAEYGSIVRGDADHLSDRDLLLVGDDTITMAATRKTLERRGYSCACYTHSQLKAMRAHGALFLQHIKHESRILHDPKQIIEEITTDFSPNPDYSDAIAANGELFSVAGEVPCNPLLISWALDVVAVAFRNLGILLLANEGHYRFGFNDVITLLQKCGKLTNSEASTLMCLRGCKADFRGARTLRYGSIGLLNDVSRILRNRFGQRFETRSVSVSQFQERCIRASGGHSIKAWYPKARLLEGAFLTRRSKHFESKLQRGIARQIERLIKTQNCYTSGSSPQASGLRQLVECHLNENRSAANTELDQSSAW